MKYTVKIGRDGDCDKIFKSNSKNIKKHILDNCGTAGGAWCAIYNNKGNLISAAKSPPENERKILSNIC